jgi:hypothetical protein
LDFSTLGFLQITNSSYIIKGALFGYLITKRKPTPGISMETVMCSVFKASARDKTSPGETLGFGVKHDYY